MIAEDWREVPKRSESKTQAKKKLLLEERENGWLRWRMKPLEVVGLRGEKKMMTVIWMWRREKTPASGRLRWSGEMMSNMDESRKEVVRVKIPMTWKKMIGRKKEARKTNPKILGFTT